MKVARRIAIGGSILVLILAGLIAGLFTGAHVPRIDPDQLADRLSPHQSLVLPEGEGPFPVALLVSGCDGDRDGVTRWAQFLVDRGYAAATVGSLKARGLYDQRKDWERVCHALALWGQERAGDVMAVIDALGEDPRLDTGRIVLGGWSHGGWTLLDLFSLAPGARPWGLTRVPDGFDRTAVEAAILLYPYCGLAARASRRGWPDGGPPALMLFAGKDSVTSNAACERLAARIEGQGGQVDRVTLPGVDHGFDQAERPVDSRLVFDERATAEAMWRVGQFLDALDSVAQ